MVQSDLERKIFVTHIMRRPADPKEWVGLVFFTQREGETHYHLGYEFFRRIHTEEVAQRVASGTDIALDKSYEIKTNEMVWLTPEKEVYIADKRNPHEDADKRKLSVNV